MTDKYKYRVTREEWTAQIGWIVDPASFDAIWISERFPSRDHAIAALEARPEVIGWSDQLMRYELTNSYKQGRVARQETVVDEYEK